MKGGKIWILLGMMIFLSLSFSGVGRAPIGEIIANAEGEVRVNDVPVAWGSTIFDGSEIQTASTTAFVRFTKAAGVLSLSEDSHVRVSIDQGRIIAQVHRGAVVMRADVASRIVASDRIIESDPANVYSVTVANVGADPVVWALQKPVRVSLGSRIETILPEAAGVALQSLLDRGDSPQPQAAAAQVATENRPLFISCDLAVTPAPTCTITITGRVFSFGNPVSGALVRAIARFGRFRVAGQARTDASGMYIITIRLNTAQCAAAQAGVRVQVLATSGLRRASCQD